MNIVVEERDVASDRGDTLTDDACMLMHREHDASAMTIYEHELLPFLDQERNQTISADDTSQAPTTKSHLAQTTKKRSTTRERQREELQSLRDAVQVLEATLVDLHRIHAADPITVAGGDRASELVQVWRAMAIRQRLQRRRSESENEQLRDTLRAQTKVAKQLFRLYRRAMTQQTITPEWRLPNVRTPGVAFDDAYDPIDLVRLERLYAGRNAEFAAARFNDGSLKFRDIHLVHDPVNSTTGIDVRAGWVTPFSVQRVLDALWTASLAIVDSKEAKCHTSVFKKLASPIDTAIVMFQGVAMTEADTFQGGMSGKITLKRFYDPVTNDGVMITTWYGSVTQNDRVMSFGEESFYRIQNTALSGSELVTRIQLSKRMRKGATSIPSRQISTLTDVTLVELEHDICIRQEMTENLLLQATTAR